MCYNVIMNIKSKKFYNEEKRRQGSRSPMDAALYYLGFRSRTIRETERYLDEKQYGEYEIYQVIERLKELDYLNDVRFANDFIAARLRLKPISRRKLRQDLMLHELEEDIIEDAMSIFTDDIERENAKAVIKKYLSSYTNTDPLERRTVVIRRTLSKGFDYSVATEAFEEIEKEFIEGANNDR